MQFDAGTKVVDHSFDATMRLCQTILTRIAEATDNSSVLGPMYNPARNG